MCYFLPRVFTPYVSDIKLLPSVLYTIWGRSIPGIVWLLPTVNLIYKQQNVPFPGQMNIKHIKAKDSKLM
jgi:hypothetical protein